MNSNYIRISIVTIYRDYIVSIKRSIYIRYFLMSSIFNYFGYSEN
jgi:hypothetical protein